MSSANGTVVKGSGPEVYLIDAGQRRWIPDPYTLSYYGGWGAVQNISDADLNTLPLGPRLPSRIPITDGTVVKGSGPKVYVLKVGQRDWIPDPETLQQYGGWNAVISMSDQDLNALPEGLAIPSVHTIPIVSADQEDTVGWGFHMQTSIKYVKATGLLDAVTHTWATNDFVGFHGVVFAWLLDGNGLIVGETDSHTFGVDGRDVPFTQNNRLDHWTYHFDPAVPVSQTVRIQIVQMHSSGDISSLLHKVGEVLGTAKDEACRLIPVLPLCK